MLFKRKYKIANDDITEIVVVEFSKRTTASNCIDFDVPTRNSSIPQKKKNNNNKKIRESKTFQTVYIIACN